MLSCCSYKGTNQNESFDIVFKNIIETSSDPTDIGHFKEIVLDAQTKRFIIENGHSKPKAKGPFAKNSDGRSFSEKYYFTVSKSGLKIERSWLCYSTILQKAYCRSCWLFGDRTSTGFQEIWTTGYCDWKHIVDGIKRHEQSHVHYISCLVYEKWFLNKTLNEELEQNIKKEKLFWRQVLERILNITLTLAMRSLPFRDHREKLGSGKGENGNFICFIELLAKYDPVLEKVINQGNNKVNYCSPKIQNELIQLISNKVEDELILNIKEAPFFSIIIDTTQDISKVDQLSEIYRYCVIEKDEYGNPKYVCVKETFLAFHEVVDQSASSLSELILQNIEKKGLSIAKCRGQGYDGAANMSGMYNGLQKRIKDIEPSAAYVHCSTHNLNLVVNDAVKEITEMEIFFDVVLRVFVFFGHSIVRWRILSDLIKESNSQNGLLIKKLNPTRWAGRYEAVFALKIRFVEIQKALTKVILCSSKCNFNDLLEEANIVAKSWSISTEFQNKRRKVVKRYFDELCTDMRLTCPESLFRLVNKYDKDISKTFTSEILAVRSTLKNQISQLNSTRDLAQLLMVKNHSLTASFPEVCTALLLFLTIPVTSASAERSFSKLKIIKGYLRSTMMQDRLSGLALISIEQETVREVDFENLIDMFAEAKARKKKF
ncbi:zinc finger MYM-type protein 1-like [Sipha flava]|uniref:Zinc finger MYM-type protein 1-like n=1 Tax=Sipha flava TaxID=143950 RepID=A0A8B8F6N4_9HEMI|nr:zinc finger MYM-type protein 1-like [Sipha flava]